MLQLRFATASILRLAFENLLYGMHPSRIRSKKQTQRKQHYGVHHGVSWSDGPTCVRHPLISPCIFLTGGCQHWVFSFIHALRSSLRCLPGENMEAYSQITSNPLLVSKTTVLQTEILIGDLIMVSVTTFVRGLD